MKPCPCGFGDTYTDCCGRYIGGVAAPTALALMRSRYSAYVLGEIEYLLNTHDPTTRDVTKRDSMERWSKDTDWQGLTIVTTEKGTDSDSTGIVEFIARGVTRGKPFVMSERSRFRKIDGTWYYTDGDHLS